MNIVFLDIDGVLNGTNFLQASVWPVVKENQFWVMALNNLDSRAVELLNELLAKTGSKVVVSSSWRSKVVVSSSWRHAWKRTQIQSLLCEKGFHGEILDMTPELGDRAVEIRMWVNIWRHFHSTINFVILDDDPVEGFGELFVKTDKKTGLTQCDVDRCVALLK